MKAFSISNMFVIALVILLNGCGGDNNDNVRSPLKHRSVEPYENNPLFYEQWYFSKNDVFYKLYDIDSDANIHPWPTTKYAGRGVKVVIIDDALDAYHEDLKSGVVATYDTESMSINVSPKSVDESHGTAVTGLALASSNGIGISGVAPGAQIYFIRIPFNKNFRLSMLVDAFEKAKEWGADVVNCSWGSGNVDDAVKSAIVDLAINGRNGKGTIIVFASGNENISMGNDESSIHEVLAVGATNRYNKRTSYSNFGPELDIMAPGGEFLGLASTDLTGNAGYSPGNYIEYYSFSAFGGTSASAPIVTGVVAQMLEADYNLTRVDVMEILRDSADKIDTNQCAYDSNGHSNMCGYGKVNVTNAINKIISGR